jgi:hypothetical protein
VEDAAALLCLILFDEQPARAITATAPDAAMVFRIVIGTLHSRRRVLDGAPHHLNNGGVATCQLEAQFPFSRSNATHPPSGAQAGENCRRLGSYK